ncbi:hypothetical protein FHG68_13220 [Leptospira weilii]|nr:hypothetical protein FHG68_13220 [Leptospira weilii]
MRAAHDAPLFAGYFAPYGALSFSTSLRAAHDAPLFAGYFAPYGARNRRENSGGFSLSENHAFCK